MDLLILDATVVTVNKGKDILKNSGIAIQGDRIFDIGASAAIKKRYPQAKKIIDGSGKIVFPGLINCHSHSYQSLLKGLGDDLVLSDWLSQMALPAAAALTHERAFYGALLCCLENIRSGVTTVVDMAPQQNLSVLEGILEGLSLSGIRGFFAKGVVHEGRGQDGLPEIAREVRQLLDKYQGKFNGRIDFMLAPFQVWGNTPQSMALTQKLMEEYGLGVTIHVAETQYDEDATIEKFALPEVRVLEKYKLLNDKLLLVHGVNLKAPDMKLLKEHEVKVCHTPVCNMYLASGVAPVKEMLEAGLTVSLGTEGAGCNNSNDMLETLKAAALLQKVSCRDPLALTAAKVLEMATIDGAEALGMAGEIGSLEKGKKADLFIFNPGTAIKAVPMHHPVSSLVYSSTGGNVETVVIDGRIILENGLFTAVDEERLIKKAQKAAEQLAAGIGINSLNCELLL